MLFEDLMEARTHGAEEHDKRSGTQQVDSTAHDDV
jgi:hypothetical protein